MKTKGKTKDLYECPRCQINCMTKGDMCPCPRGRCEAAIVGTVTITKTYEVDRTLTPEQGQWNKENYR